MKNTTWNEYGILAARTGLTSINIGEAAKHFVVYTQKKLQKGAMTDIVYKNAPQNIFHSWVEVYLDGVWYELEAFILDKAYLSRLQSINSTCMGAFCGYGVAVKDFRKPIIDFERNNTYIQSEGINQDFGIYDCPDELLKEHHQEMSALKAFLYRNLGRHLMNRNIKKIRNSA